jgi:hypothetical protein
MRGVGNLCIGGGSDARYDARRLVAALLAGLRSEPASRASQGPSLDHDAPELTGSWVRQ